MRDYLKIKKWIQESDAIVVGAGAGLSDAAGIHYSGCKFQRDFSSFIDKYGIKDLYSSSFYPFPTEEEKWAYWAKHIYFSYYERQHTKLYDLLYKLISKKDYFVITTNVDGQFLHNGFSLDKIFEVQGSYSKFQCSIPCHNQLYDNQNQVMDMLQHIDKDLKIPTSLVPKCPICGESMSVNLRSDDTFVEDQHWHIMEQRYEDFLKNHKDKKILFLEFGVGFNTPGIIRFPFEEYVYYHDSYRLIRFNQDYAEVPSDIRNQSISVSDSILAVLELLTKDL